MLQQTSSLLSCSESRPSPVDTKDVNGDMMILHRLVFIGSEHGTRHERQFQGTLKSSSIIIKLCFSKNTTPNTTRIEFFSTIHLTTWNPQLLPQFGAIVNRSQLIPHALQIVCSKKNFHCNINHHLRFQEPTYNSSTVSSPCNSVYASTPCAFSPANA